MFDVRMHQRTYLIIQLLVLVSFYIIPYVFLANTRSASLALFWISTTLLSGLLALAWLKQQETKAR